MSITHSIDHGGRRLLTVAEGPVTFSDVVAHLDQERDDNGLPLPELIEATRASVDFGAAEVHQIVERLRELGENSALGPTAVVVGNDVSYGIVRMLEVLVEDVCDVRPFRTETEAEEWLNTMPTPRPPAR